jgi:hypothetical protein
MRMEMRGEVIIGLCLCMLLFFCPVPKAADYPYRDYYNKQLTTTSTGNTRGPSISGKGDKIVFWSDQNSDPLSTQQVFLWTSTSGTYSQISTPQKFVISLLSVLKGTELPIKNMLILMVQRRSFSGNQKMEVEQQ